MKQRFEIAVVILTVLWATGSRGAVPSVARGYASSQTDLSIPTWFGGFDYLPDGRLIASDSEDVFILDEEGMKTVVAHFEEPGLFGSFVKVAPDGHTVYVGESSTGTISVFDINTGTLQTIGPGTDSLVGTVDLNYDLEFDPQGRAFLSAATPITWQPNRILLLDKETGETDLIATLQGNSGPIAFDVAGNLYYSTSTSYPPQPVESVIRFSPDAIDRAIGEGCLSEVDAEAYASNILSFSDMAFDGDGDLFGVTSLGTVIELCNSGGEVLTHTLGAVSSDALGATVVRFVGGARDFEAFYENGGTLTFLESDFGSLYRLVRVTTFPEFCIIAVEQDQEGTQVRFATEEGKQYQVYSCDDLAAGDGWGALGPVLGGTGEPVSVSDNGGEQPGHSSPIVSLAQSRFYRVKVVQ